MKTVESETIQPTQQSPCKYCENFWYEKEDCCTNCIHVDIYRQASAFVEEFGVHRWEIVQEYLLQFTENFIKPPNINGRKRISRKPISVKEHNPHPPHPCSRPGCENLTVRRFLCDFCFKYAGALGE